MTAPVPEPPRRRSIAARLYAVLLRAFPHSFRWRYGRDMVSEFERQTAQARERRGVRGVVRYWSRAVADVPGAAFRVHREQTVRHPSSPTRTTSRFGPMLDDLRHAVRSLTRAPGVTVAALLILMLGVGGSTAVFSVLNAVLLRSLPYTNSDRLAVMWTVNTRQNLPDGTSYLNFRDWRDRNRTFESMTLFLRPEFSTSTVTEFDRPERIHVGVVAWNFFDVLGVTAVHGRTFLESDLGEDARLVTIGEAIWRERYGARPNAVGSTIRIDSEDYRIVGVVPETLDLPRAETEIWQLFDPSVGMGADLRRNDAYVVLGRMREDVPFESARDDLAAIAGQLAEEYPETNANFGVRTRPLLAEITGEDLPRVLWLVFGAVVLVLLVACANVAHLMLARGAARQREIALRAALGATRHRLGRQLLFEMLVLGLVAGLGGVALGAIGLRTLVAMVPGDVPRLGEVGLDPTVLTVALLASLLAGGVFGLLPAIAGSRLDPAETLNQGSRGATRGDTRLRSGLVIAEVAMAVLLLAEAGLLIRSVQAVRAVDPGFDPERVLIAQVDLDFAQYPDPDRWRLFFDDALERVRAVPGVDAASAITDFFIFRFPDASITLDGEVPAPPDAPRPRLTADQVIPGFFETIGVPVLRGREFTSTDLAPSDDRPVVINEAMARAFWPDRDPVGQAFRWGTRTEGPVLRVVGVVANMRRSALEEASIPQVFTAGANWAMDVAVRTEGDPLVLASAVAAAIQTVDADVPVTGLGTAWTHYGESLGQRRFQTLLLGMFSGLATLLAAIGIYALLFDGVVARQREIGIRVALGADPRAVRRMFLRQGIVLAGIGLALGLGGATLVSRTAASLLYGVAPSDPQTLGTVTGLLLVVAALASWIPARRATRVDPLETLGAE